MDSRCSTNIITESLGANCCPDWFNKIWQTERKAEDFNINASLESLVVFRLQTLVLFFFTEHNMTLNRVWRSVSLCRRFQNARGNYLDLCHLLNIVGAADRGWSNLPVILRLAEAPIWCQCEEPSLYSVVKPWHIPRSCEIPVDQNVINFTPSGVVEVALWWHKYENTRVTHCNKCVYGLSLS